MQSSSATVAASTAAFVDPDLESANTKVRRRLVPFLFVLFVIAYLDRINFGFAAVAMNKDLGLSAATFGLAGTIMYLGYFLFEVPSNVLMVRFGARRWICRIMVTWGLASMATVLATSPMGIYITRLIVGIAEAGFVPGVLLYLTYWTPNAQRARANSVFMIGQPFAIGIGSLISGIIMHELDGALGYAGWKWLFILEGLPAVLLGIVVLFYLPNKPDDANWLTPREKQALNSAIAADPVSKHSKSGSWRQLWSGSFLILAFCYFALVTGLNALGTWSPLIIQEVLADNSNYFQIGVLAAIPGLLAVAAMPLWGASSDRRTERAWHYAVSASVSVAGWLIVIASSDPMGRVVGLVLATVGGFASMPILWTLPGLILTPAARPVGLAVLSMAGILGSITSPSIVGVLREVTGSFNAGMWYAAVLLGVSALTFFFLAKHIQLSIHERASASGIT